MAGYSGTPLWKKLGYKTGLRAYLDGAPDNYVQLLDLPRRPDHLAGQEGIEHAVCSSF